MSTTETTRRADADSLAIRDALLTLIDRAPAGGIFHHASTEPVYRNSFALQLDAEAPIFTVTINYGGALTSKRTTR